jgi:hypothetical protein
MTHTHPLGAQRLQDDFGRRVAARLSGGAAELPHDITERLRAGRVQALTLRKRVAPEPLHVLALAGAARSLGFGPQGLGFWGRLASTLPVVVLAAGLVAIHLVQNDLRASEVAEVDAALLTDDLPPSAYTDPGFVEFLKTDQ